MKNVLKKIAGVLGLVRALPCLVLYALCASIMDHERAFVAGSERISRIPGTIGVYARQAYYKRVLAHVGNDVYFGYMSVFSKRNARVGDRVYIGRFCSIGWAEIGDDVMLADAVQILSGSRQHGNAPTGDQTRMRDNEQVFTKVTVGNGAWLGAGAIVMADVGENAVVGAGAVVTRPVAPAVRVGGVPAKPLNTATGKSYT